MRRRDVLLWAAAGLTASALYPGAGHAGDADKGLKEITLEVTGMT